jgi:hypothetical protein
MPKPDWKHQMLTREDIGYGPARPYEATGELGGEALRERRRGNRATRSRSAARDDEPGLGPYQQRLRRRDRPDPWIQAELEEILFLDTWIDADRITIEVKNGVATLIGTLAERAEVDRALQDLRHVPGLKQLRNRLEVES